MANLIAPSLKINSLRDGTAPCPPGRIVPDNHGEIIDCLLMVGDSAWEAKDFAPAGRAYRLVLSLDSTNTQALNRSGRVELMRGNLDAAINVFSEAFMATQPTIDPVNCVNLALAYARKRDYAQALYFCAQALLADSIFLPAYVQQAAIYDETCDYDGATKVIDRAIELHPGNPDLIFARGVQALRRGDFETGWRDYEARPDRRQFLQKLDEWPEWDGSALAGTHVWVSGSVYCAKCGKLGVNSGEPCPRNGKTILVLGEQGIGDQIMWARYLPLLAELGGQVVLYTRPELARLFAASFAFARILTSDRELNAADVQPDCWVAMGSLSLHLPGRPARPYLLNCASGDHGSYMAGGRTGPLRVGLVWAGNAKHRYDALRSLTFDQLGPILDIPGVEFHSFQHGAAAAQNDGRVVDVASYCHDMADHAARMLTMDLIVTVDTAALHLAGALGVPALGLLYKPEDWRWQRKGDETDWYPSVRLIRQREPGGWATVIDAVQLNIQWRTQTRRAPAVLDPRETPERSRETQTADCRYGTMTWPANDHYIGRALTLYGEYSQSEADLLRRVLKPGDVVVEAGANVGGLTVALADIVGPGGKVHAFEPQGSYFKHLSLNTCIRNREHLPTMDFYEADPQLPHVVAWLIALGRDDRTIKIRSVETAKIHAPGWESTGPEREVEQTSLDHWNIERCDLIKIDVDGQELEILQGAEQTIARCRPVLYVENDKPERYPDLLPWILARGYRIYQHMAPLYNPDNFRGNKVNVFGGLVSAMVLCIPNERKDLRFPDLPRIRAGQAQ